LLRRTAAEGSTPSGSKGDLTFGSKNTSPSHAKSKPTSPSHSRVGRAGKKLGETSAAVEVTPPTPGDESVGMLGDDMSGTDSSFCAVQLLNADTPVADQWHQQSKPVASYDYMHYMYMYYIHVCIYIIIIQYIHMYIIQ